MKFIIATRVYNSKSNGCIALHRLADALNRQGHTAYLLFFNGHGPNPEWFYSDRPEFYCQEFSYSYVSSNAFSASAFLEDATVIYPEIISGNPLNAQMVVRYFLNGEGIIKQGLKVNASPKDFILSWSELYHSNPDFVLSYDFTETFDVEANDLSEREIDCTYIGKGEKYIKCHVIPGTFEITRTHPAVKREYLDLLKKTRYIYMWDSVTAVYSDAVLCGALPVMMTYEPFGKAKFDEASQVSVELPKPDQYKNPKDLDEAFKAYRIEFIKRGVSLSLNYDSSVRQLTEKLLSHFA